MRRALALISFTLGLVPLAHAQLDDLPTSAQLHPFHLATITPGPPAHTYAAYKGPGCPAIKH